MTSLKNMHKEDVKTAIRKRFGSVSAFERANRLPDKSVADILRGRTSARVSAAIERAIGICQPEISDTVTDRSSQRTVEIG